MSSSNGTPLRPPNVPGSATAPAESESEKKPASRPRRLAAIRKRASHILGAKSRQRSLLVFALTASLGFLLVGAWAGHRLWPREVVEATVIPRSAPSVSAQPGTMPDVLGLRESIAIRALRDAGVSAPVTTQTRAAAGPSGLVVDQTPAAGASGPTVTLTFSTTATVVPVLGMLAGDARARLEELGALVKVRQVVAPARPPGSVVAVRPAPGEPLPATVEIDVASQGDALSLTDVRALNRTQCDNRSNVKVGSAIFDKAFACRHDNDTQAPSIEFDLASRTQALSMTVGLDNAGASAPATVVVTAGTKELWRGSPVFGVPIPVTIDTNGVIRLKVTIMSPSVGPPTVVLGSPTLLGDQALMDGLR